MLIGGGPPEDVGGMEYLLIGKGGGLPQNIIYVRLYYKNQFFVGVYFTILYKLFFAFSGLRDLFASPLLSGPAIAI